MINLPIMASGQSSPGDGPGHILRFRHRRSDELHETEGPPRDDDLARFERGSETDDYRQRMITNVIAFVFIVALIGAGLWLADTMASMRKNQDCVLSGRRNCAPVEVNRDRW